MLIAWHRECGLLDVHRPANSSSCGNDYSQCRDSQRRDTPALLLDTPKREGVKENDRFGVF